jgi:DNA-binding transcriptional LysR family regulator
LAGIGVVLMPSFRILELLASGALVPLLPDYQTPEYEIVAVYPHRRHITAKVRAFIDMLVQRFASEQRRLDPGSDRSGRNSSFWRTRPERISKYA